jgi:amino acid adenylation domain-containing protein
MTNLSAQLDESGPQTAAALELPLHRLFEAQARRAPDATAALFEGRALSYRELDARANRLAHRLQKLGVARGGRVGLCIERSLDMAMALLGALKAGAAYVPLDPSYPRERLAAMARQAELSALLTTEPLRNAFPGLEAASLLLIDREAASLAEEPAHPPEIPAPAEDFEVAVTNRSHVDDLLYILFTSGSTGTPKGVAMPHRALANLLAWQQTQIPAVPGQRTLQFTPLSFDVATQEIFATWLYGGTLVLVSDAARRNPQALWLALEAERVERLFLPFVALQHLAEVARGERPKALREVVTAGEQLQITEAVAAFFAQPGCRLHNHYGPTESHVATAYTLPEEVSTWPRLPPIGRPIAGADIRLLDENLRETPEGEAGEIYIGGVCLAQGYHGRPDLTEERFLPNPFGPGRLYKTGDLARLGPDGELEFLGRADRQVKIRGYRIEPGEIEVLLTRRPEVKAAVVEAREDVPGVKRLAAYLQLAEEASGPARTEALAAEWATYLRDRLPDYMLPAAFVVLPELPLTPSGKVDRRALPAPKAQRPPLKTALTPPRGATETRIAGIWQSLLLLDAVGVEDNFFELGGTSLLLARLLTELSQWHPALEIVDLLQYPTIRALAERLDGRADASSSPASAQKRLDRRAASEDRRAQRRSHRAG